MLASPSVAEQARKVAAGIGADSGAHVLMFTKSYCHFCAKAKQIITDHDAVPVFIDLDTRDDGAAIQDQIEDITGQHTVPNIFIGDYHIGGSSDLVKIEKTGRLDGLLNAAFKEYPN